MRLTDICLKPKKGSLKKFTNYKDVGYKFKVIRVPALKDSVTSHKEKPESAPCVNEMTRVMDCWKRTDFSQTACSKETEAFMSCLAAAEVTSKLAKERALKGLPSEGSHMRPSKQVNEMLSKYPQPKYNFVD
ncbi:coiled-coil-helix-coiled-coil-helix domain-containing protein 1 [Biomphalaria glabrata]|uniref:Coiled-coil-helix-coiled-coil-helix domain-containing protein 1-like n=1 Tax=Biomphalaria glabrata TaxID=6526 RepID=A0A2C9LC96_BIOGL|nr:coiled-coil-helix-coiled-coil-helix domain-containing protein 1-like [Biomphalaria glabrata]XP_013079989.1 coiled-coil-helix-coiled-coil-helix domain-containing protein 1-like [Biomphalaria glabrata]XP_055876341.1 coiled-coil-helix-coiled-coil-helix domain-containing protein 1-like [Biomphalaria glabrata]XP_055876342.1 coiled-coil-helix-coiled-coil-helix domain-containing protein 1-like [Biomphalaria glabrata]XP_055876343.1 coiled-coil-helix-coiled-coil-helix domain-containing protein 1-like